jgi:hypothetical protein
MEKVKNKPKERNQSSTREKTLQTNRVQESIRMTYNTNKTQCEARREVLGTEQTPTRTPPQRATLYKLGA